MRIAIITNAFPPDGRGGAEQIACLQAKTLVDRGHEVRVWAPEQIGGDEPGLYAHEESGAELVRFRSPFARLSSMSLFRRAFFHVIRDISPNYFLAHDICAYKPDIVVSHNLTGCGIGTPFEIARRLHIPWAHTLHDVQLAEPSGRILATRAGDLRAEAWRRFWARYRRMMSFGSPDVCIGPTQWILDWHRKYGFRAAREVVLPNPVEIGEARDRALLLPASMLFVGRLSADKGFDAFLGAVRALDKNLPLSGIVVAGDGELELDAKRLHDDRMELCGWLTPDEVRIAIKNAAILVAPSRLLENQQTILLEAMAEGTPVIATDVGGTTETLQGTGCPVLRVSRSLPSDIAKEIKRILEDRDGWHAMSLAMQEQAKKHDLRAYGDALLGAIGELRR